MSDKGIFVCECGSLGHVYQLWYDEEFGDLHWYITVPQHRNVFQRIWRALGYIANKKPRYGDYDGIIISPEDIREIRPYLDKSEVRNFLNRHSEIEKAGMECWGNYEDLSEWLLSKTMYSEGVCGGRVIDMPTSEILDEIGRIEHGIFG
jgi:hypothetical protein